jgi:NTP pyrophosphatase (non-canonical NTP hydrolase)
MPAWLDAIMSPLNAAGEGIQKLIEVRDLAKFGDALGKLYAQVLSAQQGALAAQARESTLAEEIGELKKKVRDLEAWDAEKQRYELVALAPSVMAYAIKHGMENNEAPHYICANCYQQGKKRFLNQFIHGAEYAKFRCDDCKSELVVDRRSHIPKSLVRPRGRGPGTWME